MMNTAKEEKEANKRLDTKIDDRRNTSNVRRKEKYKNQNSRDQ